MTLARNAIVHLKGVLPSAEAPALLLPHDQRPAFRQLTKKLVVAYVVDTGGSYTFIQNRHLSEDGLDLDQLHALAVNNLIDLADRRSLRVQPYQNIFGVLMGGGFEASLQTAEEKNKLSVWVTIGNLGSGGVMAVVAAELLRHLPPALAALLLGAALLMPLAVFPWMPAPGPDRCLARESFPQFFDEIVSLLKRREVLIAILLFIAPVATFSLTNFLAGVGDDFHTSTHFVGLIGGAGVLLGGVAGCFSFRLIDRLLPLRFLYLAIGVLGPLFTLALLAGPHVPATFAVALIGEYAFRALAFTASTAIMFEAIGPNNPLAATTYCVMSSVYNVPITYMLFVDAYGYSFHGIVGSFGADAGLSLLACLILGAFLVWYTKQDGVAPSPLVEAGVNA